VSSNIDVRLLLDLNSMVPHSALGAKIFSAIVNNQFFRGFPVFFPVVALWFSGDCRKRRSRMLIGLLATCVATVLSVWMQFHLTTHVRPFLDPSLHLQGIDPAWAVGLDRLDSFPSDSATLFFSLATVIFLEHRIAGGIAFLWTLVVVGAVRVALGWHYPSDIAGSLVLGSACVYLFARIRPLGVFFERLLQRCEPRIYIVHALLFLFLADAYTFFSGLQGFYNGFGKIGAYLIGRL
jgi:undecaprenyl-diphosphatase